MTNSVLVIGGGIAGIQASLDLANRGFTVYLIEETPSIGGRMAQLDKTFPTMDCSICILGPKMIECYRNPSINLLTYSELTSVEGCPRNFHVKVLKKPRYVNEAKCTGCGTCAEKCPIKVPNEFDMGLGMRKAIYMPFPQAVPRLVAIDPNNCLCLTKNVCRICEKFCPSHAVDFDQKPTEIEIDAGAIIVATGFSPYDPTPIAEYGYGRYKNIITALEFERLICASGPTGGHLLRPSDSTVPHTIAFIQCVGSRRLDKGYSYCSSVCCSHSTKEAILVKEHYPESEVCIFYTDLRTFGKGFQEFVNRAKNEWKVKYIRAKPEIREDPRSKNLSIWYEDTQTGQVKNMNANMVILSTALVPRQKNRDLAKILDVELDEYGFFKSKDLLNFPLDSTADGIFLCGYCQGPKDIPESVVEASGAAARAAEIMALSQQRGI